MAASMARAEKLRMREVPIVDCSASAPSALAPPSVVYLEVVCPSCDERLIRMVPNGERIEAICLGGHKWRTTNEKAWWDE